MKEMMTLRDRLHNFPPCLTRILARHKSGGPLSIDEIQTNSPGMYIIEIGTLSRVTEWTHVPLWQAVNFYKGCGLDLDDTAAWRRVADYLRKRPTFRYLRASEQWTTYWKPILLSWRDAATPTWGPLIELQRRLKV